MVEGSPRKTSTNNNRYPPLADQPGDPYPSQHRHQPKLHGPGQ